MGKTSYVFQLDVETQIKVKERVVVALKNLGYKGREFKYHFDNAMSSRLCDLENLIEIKDFLPKRKKHNKKNIERG